MATAWQTLRAGGVPLAIEGTEAVPSAAELAAAALAVLAREPSGRDAEALGAWLLAWRDHWPTSFASSFGAEAERIIGWATATCCDAGRRIKLRRIAIENLAPIL